MIDNENDWQYCRLTDDNAHPKQNWTNSMTLLTINRPFNVMQKCIEKFSSSVISSRYIIPNSVVCETPYFMFFYI